MSEVDLARLAAGYAHRGVAGDDRRAATAARGARLGVGDVAVDIGGGTGRHSTVFAATGATAIVLDPSIDMARAARAGGTRVVMGRGERMPLADRCAGLVYFHLSIHHGDIAAMLAEAARVVARGRTVWVWTLAADYHRTSFLARWFPSVAEVDEGRFPAPGSLEEGLARLGMSEITVGESSERVVRTAGSWVEAVRAGFVSTLHLIAPAEVEAGLERFGHAHPDPAEQIVYDLDYVSVQATSRG